MKGREDFCAESCHRLGVPLHREQRRPPGRNKYVPIAPRTGWAVQTHGLQTSTGLELSVVREFLGELWDAWMFGEIQGQLPDPGLEKFKCETLARVTLDRTAKGEGYSGREGMGNPWQIIMADSPFCVELRGKVRAVWRVWEKVVVISRGGSPLPEKGTAGSTKERVSNSRQSIVIYCTDGHICGTNQIGFSFHTCSPSALEGRETALASKRGGRAGLEKTLLSPPLTGGFLAGMWLELSGWEGPGCGGRNFSLG